MKIIKQTSPYIHHKSSVKRMMIDVLIALLPLVIFSIVQNGFKAVSVILLSVITMIIAEFVFVFCTKQDPYDGNKKTFIDKIKTAKKNASINNITAPLVSAIIYAMMMPAGANWYAVVIGALFGIVIGKLVFGGLGSNIFNPAALGRVVVMICFGSNLNSSIDLVASGTPLVDSSYLLSDLFLGFVPGAMGEVSKLLIIISAVYLILRKSVDPRPMLAMIVTFIVLMIFAGINSNQNAFSYMLYNLFAGGLLFGAVFMITDPVTSPTTAPGRITYGILVAVIVVLIRLFGAYPEGVAFSLLIGNMLVPVIDYYKWQTSKINYKHIIMWSAIMVFTILIIVFGM